MFEFSQLLKIYFSSIFSLFQMAVLEFFHCGDHLYCSVPPRCAIFQPGKDLLRGAQGHHY